MSGLSVGSLIGVYAKAFLDQRQFRYTKAFEYKETRYKALTILMWTAANPAEYELAQLKQRRPEIRGVEDLERELELEYNNAMIFASDKVLANFRIFLVDKSMTNFEAVAKAIREDLYL